MKKITILKQEFVASSATFKTIEKVSSWLDFHKSQATFGKEACWSEEFLEGAKTRQVERVVMEDFDEETGTHPVVMVTEYYYPAEYTYEIVDDFSQDIQELQKVYEEEVKTKMIEVFGTENISANAIRDKSLILLSMREYPALFVSDSLSTNEMVFAYANSEGLKIAQYGLWLTQRQLKLELDKAAMGGV